MGGHNRRSIRLQNYDYSGDGLYYVTICTWQRECLFSEIVEGNMFLNQAGEMVLQCWENIPNHFPHVFVDEFVIMPNYIHGIIQIKRDLFNSSVGAKNLSPALNVEKNTTGTSKTIGSIIRGFKVGVTKWMRQSFEQADIPQNVWQRNYYERVIRSETELMSIRDYIFNNPMKWSLDAENPVNIEKK